MWKKKEKKKERDIQYIQVSGGRHSLNTSSFLPYNITSNKQGLQVCFPCQSPDVRCLRFSIAEPFPLDTWTVIVMSRGGHLDAFHYHC